MEDSIRKSTRAIKIRREEGFIYDSDSVRFLQAAGNAQGDNTGDLEVFCPVEDKDIGTSSACSSEINWAELYKLPSSNCVISNQCLSSESPVLSQGSGSQSLHQNTSQLGRLNSISIVYSSSTDSEISEGARVLNSSTRGDFLDLDNCIWSASSAVYTDTSDMDQPCVCKSGKLAGDCCYNKASGSKGSSPATDDQSLYRAVMTAVGKIDLMSDKVKSLEDHIVQQDKRIEELIASSGKESGSNDSDVSGAKPNRTKSKDKRIQEEKERQYRMLQQKLKNQAKDKDSKAGSDGSSESDGGLDMKSMRKKMSKKQKSRYKQRVDAVLKHAGATFPEDDFESTTSSGTDSGSYRGKRSYRKKVKSGASIKKRPVIRTELWPHTIANEEDGEEVTCDNISLAKFFACFTCIMMDCKGLEAKGRTGLLHAVSLVLEALYWSEARSFHNIVMVKVEQNKLDWASNFGALAEDFIDRKVRQCQD